MGHIPDAILDGATIVLADNIGKDVSDIEASNLIDFSAFTHNGTVTNGVLELGENERLTYPLSKDGNYTVIVNTEGSGMIRMPKAHTAFLDIDITNNGYFKFPILFTTQNADRNLIINGSSSGLSIKEILIMYSKN